MKKIIIATSILLLAAACSKQPSSAISNPQSQAQPTPQTQPTPTPTSAPTKTPPANTPPLTLNIYNNTNLHFKVLYLSYFSVATPPDIKANSLKNTNTSACVPFGVMPSICFALLTQPYQATNLVSAAVGVSILSNKPSISDCGTFTASELNGGQQQKPIQVNSLVFVTAVATDAGAGNYAEEHMNRTWMGNKCYEIDETIRWANAGNFSPAKTEFDRADIWGKLDVLRNGFSYVK